MDISDTRPIKMWMVSHQDQPYRYGVFIWFDENEYVYFDKQGTFNHISNTIFSKNYILTDFSYSYLEEWIGVVQKYYPRYKNYPELQEKLDCMLNNLRSNLDS